MAPRVKILGDDEILIELVGGLGTFKQDSTTEVSLSLFVDPLAERDEAE